MKFSLTGTELAPTMRLIGFWSPILTVFFTLSRLWSWCECVMTTYSCDNRLLKVNLKFIFSFLGFSFSGPGFQIWDSNLRLTSYFSFNLILSNCWLLVFGFLQDSAVKTRFWTFFSVNYWVFFSVQVQTWNSAFQIQVQNWN